MRTYSVVIITILAGLFMQASAVAHDTHISYCQIVESARGLAGKVTYFRDDWFRGLRRWKGISAESLARGEINQIAQQFLSEYFHAAANGSRSLEVIVKSVTFDGPSVLIGFEIPLPGPVRTLSFLHSALFLDLSDQMNLIVVNVHGHESTHIFTSSSSEFTITV